MCFYESFTEEQTSTRYLSLEFIVSCIVVALDYIHSCNIIHRDLKPENIVFEEGGYARITDFGVARRCKDDNAEETSGTPGYMSPEVICRMRHSFETDFFALGVIVYELVLGMRPYSGTSRAQIREQMLSHQARLCEGELPPGWNPSCADFVTRLLKRNRKARLGYSSI
jgi:serine/threonine protein kinase